MTRQTRRCPTCASTVLLDRDFDCLAYTCLGCSRRGVVPSASGIDSAALLAQLRDAPPERRRGRPRKVQAPASA